MNHCSRFLRFSLILLDTFPQASTLFVFILVPFVSILACTTFVDVWKLCESHPEPIAATSMLHEGNGRVPREIRVAGTGGSVEGL